mmetsp:Transcript_29277/g.44297  ORF Transcript_29277/g.44297 Transcript_29277/m.44297 type:complete len:264 (-) Transcript_29277:164-955(-)
MGNCCQLFCAEFRYPFFGLEEVNGTLDLDKTFRLNEHSNGLIKLLKFALFAWVTASFIHAWITRGYPAVFMAFLTHWTVSFQIAYLGSSFLLSLFGGPRWLVNFAWLQYSLAVVFGVGVVLVFWFTEYDTNNFVLDYWQVFAHGGSFLITFFDGYFINQTPMRLKHCLYIQLWATLFVAWSIIFTVAGIDNPFKDDDESQGLYKILDWEEDPSSAAIVSAVMIIVVLPVNDIIFWSITLCCRYYVEEKDGDNAEIDETTMLLH